MTIFNITIGVFILLEFLNVIILYNFPTSSKGNGVGVFDDYEGTEFQNYMVNWVAGTKLIFLMLSGVIAVTGSLITQFLTCILLVISISTFYYRLYPSIKRLDEAGRISPKGYSYELHKQIITFIIVFSVASIVGYFYYF